MEECSESNLTEEEIRSASSWLKMKGMVDLSEVKEVKYELGDEGKKYLENGTAVRHPPLRFISIETC